MEDRRRKKKPVFNIPTENGKFVELGAGNMVAGKKDKINRTGQSKGLDDIILGSDVETMKVQKERSRNLYIIKLLKIKLSM